MKQDKRGSDKMISMYWFLILFLVAAAVVYMAAVFYGKPFDVREVEANLLVNKIADCFADENYFRTDLTQDNFMQKCHLNFNVEDEQTWKDDQLYVRVDIEPLGDIIEAGNKEVLDFCSAELTKNAYCIERKLYAIDIDNNPYYLSIKAGVRKTEKNVR